LCKKKASIEPSPPFSPSRTPKQARRAAPARTMDQDEFVLAIMTAFDQNIGRLRAPRVGRGADLANRPRRATQ
jgi:hypothetical protein